MVVERRRHLRHKVHSPAYASIGAGVGGVVLDANEGGAAVESVARLAPQSFVDLRLDLLETHSTAVTPARVAWSDNGRAGLEFVNLTGESRRQLQQWLLLNALLAVESASRLAQEAQTAAEVLKQEFAEDAGLRQLAEQAVTTTGAHGAALALAKGNEIVCRATAGEMAPPTGTRLDAQAGISGACVRERRWLRCDDPDLDPYVDRESCQALGVKSILAVPMLEQGEVLGLIEVYSRQPHAFTEEHSSALQALAESVVLSRRPKPVETTPAVETPAAEAAQEPPPVAGAEGAAAQPAPGAATEETQETPQVAVAEPAQGVIPAAVVAEPAKPAEKEAAAEASPVLANTTRQQTADASGGGRIVLLGVAAALLIVGLWYVLGRSGGEMRQVDAAESGGAQSKIVERPASAPGSETATGKAAAEINAALRELRQRAESGDADGEFELGAKYATGEDAPQNYAEAVKWFTRAAEGGQVLAAATLGAYYWAGRGVPQDDVSAYMWSSIARQGGDEASKYRLAILRSRMSAQQIMEGEQRAARWRQAHVSQPVESRLSPQ